MWNRQLVDVVDIGFSPSGIYGKQRHVTGWNKETNRPIHYNSDKENANAEEIALFFTSMAGSKHRKWSDEVQIMVEVSRPLAKSNPNYKVGSPDTITPDVDNIGKLVLDAITGLAFADDSQVTLLHVEKMPRTEKTARPYMRIRISYFKNERITK